MLQGDIDLTENLDFYHDKKRESKHTSGSIIPWKRDDEVVKSSKSPDDYIYATYTHNTNYWQINWLNDTTATIDTSTPYTIDYYYDNMINYYISSTSTLTDTNIYWYNLENSSTYYSIPKSTGISLKSYDINLKSYDIDEEAYNYSPILGKPKPKRKVKDIKLKYYDYNHKCLGDHKDKEVKSLGTKIFHEKPKRNYELYRDKILFSLSRDPRFLRLHIGSDSFLYWTTRFMQNVDSTSKKKIPWLSKLDSNHYNDYMKELRGEEETDYSSYLTNMHWLRIH